MTRRLRVGDRVHFPGSPLDFGTVYRERGFYLVLWDDDHLDPVTRRGRLTDFDTENPVVVIRRTHSRRRRRIPN